MECKTLSINGNMILSDISDVCILLFYVLTNKRLVFHCSKYQLY